MRLSSSSRIRRTSPSSARRSVELPVLVALARAERAGIAAAHRDHDVAACTTSCASGLGNSCEMSIPSPPESQGSGRRSALRRRGVRPRIRLIRSCSCGRAQDRSWESRFAGILSQSFGPQDWATKGAAPSDETTQPAYLQALRETGATGLEPATSGVTGRYGRTGYDRLRPGITGCSRHFLGSRTGCGRLRPASTRYSLCGRCVVGAVPSTTTIGLRIVLSSTGDGGDDGARVSAGPVKYLALLLVPLARTGPRE
jgi:hypothetical protein